MLRTKADGSFSLETIATRLGVFATTDDHRFAGAVVASDLSQSIDVTMHPTATVRGRLSDPDDNPVAGRAINVYATVRDPKQVQAANPVGIIVFPPSMRAAKRTATTNDDGEFVFEGLPCQVELTFYAEGQDWQLGKMNLQPGAEPPVTQWSLEHTVTDSQ